MDADRCVICGDIIPEGTQVCVNCINSCNECGWESNENCKACMMESETKKITGREVDRIKG